MTTLGVIIAATQPIWFSTKVLVEIIEEGPKDGGAEDQLDERDCVRYLVLPAEADVHSVEELSRSKVREKVRADGAEAVRPEEVEASKMEEQQKGRQHQKIERVKYRETDQHARSPAPHNRSSVFQLPLAWFWRLLITESLGAESGLLPSAER